MKDEWESPSFLNKAIDSLGSNHVFSFIYTKYIKTLGIKGNENILDFGSGSGAGSKHLAKLIQNNNGHLTCLDTSLYWTSVAKKRLKKYKNIIFYTDSISKLNLQADSYDIVYIHYTLHHVPKAQRDSIVSEFYRIIKPSGRICIKEPQRENDGIPADEIEALMSANRFVKSYSNNKNGTFSAVYEKQIII